MSTEINQFVQLVKDISDEVHTHLCKQIDKLVAEEGDYSAVYCACVSRLILLTLQYQDTQRQREKLANIYISAIQDYVIKQ